CHYCNRCPVPGRSACVDWIAAIGGEVEQARRQRRSLERCTVRLPSPLFFPLRAVLRGRLLEGAYEENRLLANPAAPGSQMRNQVGRLQAGSEFRPSAEDL